MSRYLIGADPSNNSSDASTSRTENFVSYIRRWSNHTLDSTTDSSTPNNQRLQQFLVDVSENKCRKYCTDFFPLHEAVAQDAPDILEKLLEITDEETMFMKDTEGKSVLHCAVQKKSLEICEIIFNKKPKLLKEKDNVGNTALHYMVKYKFLEGCQKVVLLDDVNSQYINEINNKKLTAVHIAARENCEQILNLLLQNGGKPDSRTLKLNTPLHYAAENGFNRCVALLLNVLDDNEKFMNLQNSSGSTALILAAKKGFSFTCRLLEQTNVNLTDNTGSTALHYAAGKGYLSLLTYLFGKGARSSISNNKSQTVLDCALSSSKGPCLTYLFENENTFKNAIPQDLLKVVVTKNNYECLEMLLVREDMKSVINYQFEKDGHNTLLHLSISKGNYKITQLLLDHEADKNLANDRKEYPLHLAAKEPKLDLRDLEEERLDVCREIIKGSHELVNHCNIEQETPLHLAAKSGNIVIIRSLLKKGSRVMSCDDKGETTVHVAARAGQDVAVKTLLRGLTGQERKELGESKPHPLHLAAEFGYVNSCIVIVKELKMSAVIAMDHDDQLAVDIACKYQQNKVLSFLLGEDMIYDGIDKEELCCRLHQYCEISILQGNKSTFDVIIESTWCQVAFDSFYCSNMRKASVSAIRPCQSFSCLVKSFPDAACRVMDKHITSCEKKKQIACKSTTKQIKNCQDSQPTTSKNLTRRIKICEDVELTILNDTRKHIEKFPDPKQMLEANLENYEMHNYSIFEFFYYNVAEGSVKTLFSSEQPYQLSATSQVFPDRSWLKDHPLRGASEVGSIEVLTHALTRSWLDHKYNSYTWYLLCFWVVFNIATAILVSIMFAHLSNTLHLNETFNGTSREEMTEIYNGMNSIMDDHLLANKRNSSEQLGISNTMMGMMKLKSNTTKVVALQITVWHLFVMHFFVEIRLLLTKHHNFLDAFTMMRYLRLLCLLTILVPFSEADFFFGLRHEYTWQIGIIAVLLSWLLLVCIVNQVPEFTVFMIVTYKFFFNYFKVVIHLVFTILGFALSFHFLLSHDRSFAYIPYAFVKSLVWMLGNLEYEDTFIGDDKNDKLPNYPIESNILFVLFVGIIGAFVFNFLVKVPSEALAEMKQKAKFCQANNYLNLILLMDEYFPWLLMRKYAVGKKCIPKKVSSGCLKKFGSFSNDINRLIAASPDCKIICLGTEATNTIELTSIKNQMAIILKKIGDQNESMSELTRTLSSYAKKNT